MGEARDRMLAQTSSSIFGGSGEPMQAPKAPHQTSFEPKYSDYNARQEHLRQLYGDMSDVRSEFSNTRQKEVDLGFYGGNRPATKPADQSSPDYGKRNPDTFYQRHGNPQELRENNSAVDPRSHQYNSQVFGDQKTQYQVSENRHQITGQFDRDPDELQKRYQNKNYSNLFDRECGVPSESSGSPDKLQVSTAQWQNTASEAISRREYDDYDARAFRGEQMRSVLDREVPNYAKPKPEPKVSYDVVPERKAETGTTTFIITGLQPNDGEDQIRSKCRGVHFVSIKPEVNQISGKCIGSAMVTVRGEGVERFRLNMAYSGWEVQEYTPDVGRHYDISSNEKWWQTEQKRPTNSDLDAAQIRKRNIETSENLFGGSSGVGKWYGTNDAANDPEFKAQAETVFQWQRMKNTGSRQESQPNRSRYF